MFAIRLPSFYDPSWQERFFDKLDKVYRYKDLRGIERGNKQDTTGANIGASKILHNSM